MEKPKPEFIPDLNGYRNLALEMALENLDKFCKVAGVDFKQFKVCVERSRGLSLGQISQKLSVPKSTVRDIVNKCT